MASNIKRINDGAVSFTPASVVHHIATATKMYCSNIGIMYVHNIEL